MTAVPARVLRAVAVAVTLTAAVAALLDLHEPARVAAVVAFLLVAPGLAVVASLSVETAVGQIAVAVGSSVAILVLVAELFLFLGVSSASWTFMSLAVFTLATCGIPTAVDRREVGA